MLTKQWVLEISFRYMYLQYRRDSQHFSSTETIHSRSGKLTTVTACGKPEYLCGKAQHPVETVGNLWENYEIELQRFAGSLFPFWSFAE